MQWREVSELLGKLCCRNDCQVRGKKWAGPLVRVDLPRSPSDFWCGVEAFVGSSPRRKEVGSSSSRPIWWGAANGRGDDAMGERADGFK